jgi:hypothetical protein
VAFPNDPLPLRQELLIDGTWTDVTSRNREAAAIQITRGFSGEQASVSAGSCEFTLDDRDGYLSNRNPNSPYFGLVGRNTQTRVSQLESVPFLKLADYSDTNGNYDGAEVYTADKAVLDITGDIDIRADIQPDRWTGGAAHLIAGKYVTTANQRSWLVYLDTYGYVHIIWSPDGTSASRINVSSTAPVPMTGPRLTIRVTLDVNNGAAGNTTAFYTSNSVSGSWTSLGSPVVLAGTTSIFSSTSALEIATINGGSGRGVTLININPFIGKVYRFQVYDGIAGTLRADMYPGGQAEGVTSWSDGLSTPNTWLTAASAEITKNDYRFWGEIPKLPQRWDSTGSDVTVPTHAGDLLERLGQGSKPLSSPIRINIGKYVDSPTGLVDGYWPCEDSSDATAISAVVGKAGQYSGASFTADSTLPGSAGGLVFSDDAGYALGETLGSHPLTKTVFVLCYFKFPSVPAVDVPFMIYTLGGGTVSKITLSAGLTTYTMVAAAHDGTVLGSSVVGHGTGATPDQWLAMRILFTESAGTVSWQWGWYPVGAPVLYGTNSSFSATIGRAVRWLCPATPGRNGTSISQVVIARADIDFATVEFTGSTNAYMGELAGDRFARICRQIGQPYWVVGRQQDDSSNDLTERMGPQPLDTSLNILKECAEIDGGYLYGPRDKFGLALRLRSSFINAYPVEMDYSAKVLSGSILPDENTTGIRNDVTVNRTAGGFARWSKTTGPLNTSEPFVDPDGVGVYDTSLSRNAYLESRLIYLAQDEVARGTVDELRYPQVMVELARRTLLVNTSLTAAVRALNLGDVIRLSNLPAWMPPDDVDQLVQGYTEWLRNRSQEFTWNLAPYSPYVIPLFDDPAGNIPRMDTDPDNPTLTDGSTTSGAGSITIATPWGSPAWSTTSGFGGELPFDAKLGGEVVTVTACSTVTPLDGTFESGVANWTATDCTLAQSAVFVYDGAHSALMTVTGSPLLAYFRPGTSYRARVTAGGVYTLFIRVRSAANLTDVRASIDWFDAGGGYLSTSDSGGPDALASASGWQGRRVFRATAPANATSMAYGPTILSSPTAGTLLYVDNIEVSGNGWTFQTLTATRSVNGVVKAHASGTPISLANPSNLGL